ncbi:ABC-2 transporter permease [Ornithinibacillus sp. 179-J 7C1 HS]|uniref:ABC-2 transporter permease n=1 Tax=Ornithinibacillus sp. 179-J 7C1 HS TaxID=3142384 RepID=UPI00399F82A1
MNILLKRDYINLKTVNVTSALIIPLGFILSIPPFAISLGLLLHVLLVGVFYSDHRSSVNRFMISLPIERSALVISRYLIMIMIWLGIILYQFLWGHFFDYFVPYPVFVFGWKELLAILSLGLLILAVCVPLYYLFNSFIIPTIIIFSCYFIGFIFSIDALVNISGMSTEIIFNDLDQWTVPLIESIIPVYPFIILPSLGICLYYCSMKVSETIIRTKKII